MKIEIRADESARVEGYVNVTGKKSRPVITPHGKCVEVVEEHAFSKALEKAENIPLTRDHDPDRVLAETRAGSLKLYEDAIGLHYDAVFTDPETVADAKAGKVRGMSFGMTNVSDRMEERAGELPLRHIQGMNLEHITLVIKKVPAYSATSVELRAGGEVEAETRATEEIPELLIDKKPEKPDYTAWENKIRIIKGEK